jgi:NADH-quinone oxidoreductase subunit D
VRSHGASGVVARASGVHLDLRLTDPDYAEVRHLLHPAPWHTGSVAARIAAMISELSTTLTVIDALAQQAVNDSGAVNSPLPKVLRVPVGRSRQWCESPLGAAGALLESRGDRAPYRYALRTPSFAHAPLLAKALVGHTLAEAPAIVSSFPIVVGDLDK